MAIVVAGSETITTALSGAIYHLLTNPSIKKQVVDDIRSKFASEDQITASAVTSMPYFTAVLNETLRMCPPLPDNLRREVPKGGATRSLNENSDSAYEKDKKANFHPFSTGPHNCLGQPLAWVELRIILARILWNFDVSVPVGRTLPGWTEQKIYWTWEKQPLEVQLKRAS
ncbi:hypothetical protein HYFRA_00005709 [Hymenoscyphus fraxineus]|uniref:Cytochrome P450 n=1 Tax=Hymenoscyphus fraxineus TaxID=746836 RepID=A0A9N9PQB7_9HELO|nr:hypothetical protein HYFRA_00005709 [Hymenoscyphus fraxineus]